MKVTITDDEGLVFAEYRLGKQASAVLLARLDDGTDPDDVRAAQDVESFIMDLSTAARCEVTYGGSWRIK